MSPTDATAIRQVLASNPSATAAFTAGTLTPTTTGDIVARLSGRGPAVGTPSILKPDLLAPGADIIMAHSPRIDPNRAADAGLVLDETTARFQEFLAIQDPARDPTQPTPGGTDLNLPSIGFDPLLGPRSTSRTFTSTDAQPGTWRASFEGLAGIAASAEPAQFSIGPGESRTVQFAIDPTGARIDEYVDGAVILTNEGRPDRPPPGCAAPRAVRGRRTAELRRRGHRRAGAACRPDGLPGRPLGPGLRVRPAGDPP